MAGEESHTARPHNTPADAPPHPGWSYADWPYAPREGIQGTNNHYLTRSLFLETCLPVSYPLARYVLDDHDIYAAGEGRNRWFPSARLIYIHAMDEYDAARKLVGNLRHWERLFDLKEFADVIDDWRAEQAHIQRSAVHRALMKQVESGAPGSVSAARALLQMVDGKQSGRPRKDKSRPKADLPSDADHLRLVAADGERK